MALQARKVSGAFEKQGPRPPKDKLFAEVSIEDYCEICKSLLNLTSHVTRIGKKKPKT